MKIAIILGISCLIFIGCVTEEVHHEPHVDPYPSDPYPSDPDPNPYPSDPDPNPYPTDPEPYPPHNETPSEQSGKEFFNEDNNSSYKEDNHNHNHNSGNDFEQGNDYVDNDSSEEKTADDWLGDDGRVEEEVSGKDAFDNGSEDLSEPAKDSGPTDPIDDFMDDGRVEEETSGDDFFDSDY
ncbi:hypothetical protein [Candidatus Uabimicrobium amorphum]|uniref:Uncharacterized protein n=1 Tax=Uabimicrobium amorphum TaxID=2596890 RepID=A0A5S9F4C8_UABAM|nr:hypothetical protein [Candidatus Uabimicrobium amorphum]BBM85412.1 hypothetical protein UABAM_03779 [Candidatus Uabimicrobium amorphum]